MGEANYPSIGWVSAGKSTLCDGLVRRFGAYPLKTKELTAEAALADSRLGRGQLQHVGDLLDRRTKGEWVARALTRLVQSLPDDAIVVVDAVRIIEQAMGFSHKRTTHHFHLFADGGAIEIQSNEPTDTASQDAIREHLAGLPLLVYPKL